MNTQPELDVSGDHTSQSGQSSGLRRKREDSEEPGLSNVSNKRGVLAPGPIHSHLQSFATTTPTFAPKEEQEKRAIAISTFFEYEPICIDQSDMGCGKTHLAFEVFKACNLKRVQDRKREFKWMMVIAPQIAHEHWKKVAKDYMVEILLASYSELSGSLKDRVPKIDNKGWSGIDTAIIHYEKSKYVDKDNLQAFGKRQLTRHREMDLTLGYSNMIRDCDGAVELRLIKVMSKQSTEWFVLESEFIEKMRQGAFIVFDDAHYLKNFDSLRSTAARTIIRHPCFRKSSRALLMSGTLFDKEEHTFTFLSMLLNLSIPCC
jgi:hypothetical protein